MKKRNNFTPEVRNKMMESLGGRIALARIDANLTQRKLAEALDCDDQTICNYENNKNTEKITFEQIEKICAVLKVDYDYLCGRITHRTKELETVCNYTGLSEKAAEELHSIKSDSSIIQALSNLLENHKNSFIGIITNINSYCINMAIHNTLISITNPDEITNDLASEHFNRASSAYSNCQLWITDIGHASAKDKFYINSITPYLDRILMDNIN